MSSLFFNNLWEKISEVNDRSSSGRAEWSNNWEFNEAIIIQGQAASHHRLPVYINITIVLKL